MTAHIVHVVYRFAVGGLENGLVNLVNRLPSDAWRHTIVSLTDVDAAFAKRLQRRDVRLIALAKPAGHALRIYPRLYGVFSELAPEIVHTRNLAALEAMPAAWLAGVKVRVHGEHGRDAHDPDGRDVRRQRIRRLFRPFVTHYVAVSPDLASYLTGPIGVRESRVEQIFNGVDVARFAPARDAKPPAGTPFDDPSLCVVGTVGRLDPVKGHATLARAFVAARALRPDLARRLRLVIVGDGPERAAIESALGDARDHAWLPGERSDIPDLLRHFGVFVLPSIGEGVSNTLLEAMASGLPVVATRVGANADLVGEDGSAATLVPPADVDALATAIVRYADDDALARAHGRAARVRVEQRFTLERMVERYQRMYADALSRGRARRLASARRVSL